MRFAGRETPPPGSFNQIREKRLEKREWRTVRRVATTLCSLFSTLFSLPCYNNAMTYTWLLFDADGTLFDFDQAERLALEMTFQAFELAFGDQAERAFHEINAAVWLDFEQGRISSVELRVLRFERLFAALDWQADAKAVSAFYQRGLASHSTLLPGAEQTVRALAGRYRLAIITNGLQDVQRPRLAASPIAQYMEAVVISEEVGAAKPSPLFFDAAFALIGNPPKELVLVIGDSLTSDIMGGALYGLDTCWVNPKGQPGEPELDITYEIRMVSELPGLLGV